MLKRVDRIKKIVIFIVKEYLNHDCSKTAASLAYSTLLAMVPLMLVSLSLASHVPAFAHLSENAQQYIVANFLAGSAGSIFQYLNEFIVQVNQLSWMNLTAFTITGLLLLYNMVMAFNTAWNIEVVWHWHFTLHVFTHFIILLLAPLMLGILMFIMSYVMSLSLFSNPDFHNILAYPFVVISPYLAAVITFSFLNWALPTDRVKWRYAMMAGFLSMILFEILKRGFTLYLKIFPTYKVIYGALATIPILFIWIYLSWVVLLIGALFCRGLHDSFKMHQ